MWQGYQSLFYIQNLAVPTQGATIGCCQDSVGRYLHLQPHFLTTDTYTFRDNLVPTQISLFPGWHGRMYILISRPEHAVFMRAATGGVAKLFLIGAFR